MREACEFSRILLLIKIKDGPASGEAGQLVEE